jgi:hypothetical protein
MGTSPLDPQDIRAAAGAHQELGPDYSDAVVASFLEKVNHEIAARVDERLAAISPQMRPVEPTPRARAVEPENRRTLLKGFALGVAASIAVVLLVVAARPGHHMLVWPVVLAAAGAVGAVVGRRYRPSRAAEPRQGPAAASGDYRRI